jgi:hypothetical protein
MPNELGVCYGHVGSEGKEKAGYMQLRQQMSHTGTRMCGAVASRVTLLPLVCHEGLSLDSVGCYLCHLLGSSPCNVHIIRYPRSLREEECKYAMLGFPALWFRQSDWEPKHSLLVMKSKTGLESRLNGAITLGWQSGRRVLYHRYHYVVIAPLLHPTFLLVHLVSHDSFAHRKTSVLAPGSALSCGTKPVLND